MVIFLVIDIHWTLPRYCIVVGQQNLMGQLLKEVNADLNSSTFWIILVASGVSHLAMLTSVILLLSHFYSVIRYIWGERPATQAAVLAGAGY